MCNRLKMECSSLEELSKLFHLCLGLGWDSEVEVGHGGPLGLHSLPGWSGSDVGCQEWQVLHRMVRTPGCFAGL